jgi:sulfite reductase alpha subunit-like flavoprotein
LNKKSGIAPFYAFFEEREYLKSQGIELGEAIFFFGVRTRKDIYYKNKLEEFYKNKIITKLFIVYSDEKNGNEPPMFVSNKIEMEGDELFKLFEIANFYVCG